MKVSAVMTAPAVTIRNDATFADIVDTLVAHRMGGLPVVDLGGRLVGVVTEADLVSKDAYARRHRRPLSLIANYLRNHDGRPRGESTPHTAGELMTTSPDVALPDDDVDEVARRMVERRHNEMPVVDSAGHVVGLVSRDDLLHPVSRPDQEILADIQHVLDDYFRVPERHEARASVMAGLVTLHGTTQWPSDIAIIEMVVGRISGVVTVSNQLSAREPEPRFSSSR